MKELSHDDLSNICGGNAAGNAVIGGLGGLRDGMTFCKIPHPILAGVCIASFTAGGAYLAYKAN